MYLKDRNTTIPYGYEQIFFYMPTKKIAPSNSKIIEAYEKGGITRNEINMVSFLYDFGMATTDQMAVLFDASGNEKKIKDSLNKLVKWRLLNKFVIGEIGAPYSTDAMEIFCIDKCGASILSVFNDGESYASFKIERVYKTAHKSWKHLVMVDLYIRLLQTCPNKLAAFKVEPLSFTNKSRIKPHYGLALSHLDSIICFAGGVISDYEVAGFASTSDSFTSKVGQYEKLVSSSAYTMIFGDIEKPPVLLFITESDETMRKVAEIVSQTGIIEKAECRYTTYEKLMNMNLADAGVLFSYRNGNFSTGTNALFAN